MLEGRARDAAAHLRTPPIRVPERRVTYERLRRLKPKLATPIAKSANEVGSGTLFIPTNCTATLTRFSLTRGKLKSKLPPMALMVKKPVASASGGVRLVVRPSPLTLTLLLFVKVREPRLGPLSWSKNEICRPSPGFRRSVPAKFTVVEKLVIGGVNTPLASKLNTAVSDAFR